jgi:hypothetical protein
LAVLFVPSKFKVGKHMLRYEQFRKVEGGRCGAQVIKSGRYLATSGGVRKGPPPHWQDARLVGY